MSTTVQKNFYTNYSFKVKSKAKGYYTYEGLYNADSNTNINITQQVYNGATLTYTAPLNSAATLSGEFINLPNYKKYYGNKFFCLMPEGRNYKEVLLSELNPYLINEGCTIENGIATKTSNNFIRINKSIGEYSSLTATIKCFFDNTSQHMAVMSDSTSTEIDFGLRNTGYFALYKGGWKDGVTNAQANTWYYLRLVVENNTTTLYSLLDTNYTYDTLPSLENWTTECSINSNFFTENSFILLGYDQVYPEESLDGKIDLNNSKIIIDNEVLWEYPQSVPTKYNLDGCLHNYTDDGSAANLDCYCLVKNDNTEQKLILTQDNSVNVTGYDSMYVGTVGVPAHDTYSYSEQSTPTYETVNLIGDTQLDTTTGVLSSFSNDNYAELPLVFNPENNTWEFQIKFLRTTSGDSQERLFALGGVQEYRGVTLRPYYNASNGFISSGNNGWDISAGTQGNYNLELNTVYYCKVQFTGSAYICYFSTDGTTWEEDARFTSSTPLSNITLPAVFGTADSPSSQTFNGNIYLDGCYLKIGNETVWSGYGTHTVVVWTRD